MGHQVNLGRVYLLLLDLRPLWLILPLFTDMPLFGQYPAQDDFYLVMCSHCSQVVKPQAFQAHYGKSHTHTHTHTVHTYTHKQVYACAKACICCKSIIHLNAVPKEPIQSWVWMFVLRQGGAWFM